MRTYPDETIFPVGFDEDNLMKGTHGGVMRHELESNSRQTCRKWFPYIKALAAKHDLRAIRERHAVGSYTQFVMVPIPQPTTRPQDDPPQVPPPPRLPRLSATIWDNATAEAEGHQPPSGSSANSTASVFIASQTATREPVRPPGQ